MSFVQWVAALALVVLGLAGLYFGVVSILRRRWEYPPYTLAGAGAIAMGALYLAGAAVALAAALMIALKA